MFPRTSITRKDEVADRGGKAWHSYAVLAYCQVVGGDSRKLLEWLALPELVHTASLVVQDAEDQFAVRWGGRPRTSCSARASP